jgi:hypothetical protein
MEFSHVNSTSHFLRVRLFARTARRVASRLTKEGWDIGVAALLCFATQDREQNDVADRRRVGQEHD